MRIKKIIYLIIIYVKINLVKSYFIPEIQNSIYDNEQINENDED